MIKSLLSSFLVASASVAIAVPAAAIAQTGQAVTVGAQVKDTNGGVVGTIASVDGPFYIVKTDRHEVRLPSASFTPHEGSLLFGMTRDQLNAEVDKSKQAAEANLAVGAVVTGAQGASVGTIDALDDQFVTVKLTSGKLVRLPRSGIAAGPSGAVIGMSAAELEAQVSS